MKHCKKGFQKPRYHKLNLNVKVVAVLEGDRTDHFRRNGTSCPFKLLPDGNTEILVDGFVDIGGEDGEEMKNSLIEMILKECAENGTVIRHTVISDESPTYVRTSGPVGPLPIP